MFYIAAAFPVLTAGRLKPDLNPAGPFQNQRGEAPTSNASVTLSKMEASEKASSSFLFELHFSLLPPSLLPFLPFVLDPSLVPPGGLIGPEATQTELV